ncbi:Protein MGA2 like protein [Verticillium longisporum]|nr:Protein MGA2 like protein [Verticillium longisporum]
MWKKDENRRVIVFNTNEIKEWQPPSATPADPAVVGSPEPQYPAGALQVDAPMRIACYCRHHAEKMGFRVVFTIKDWQDRVVAQEMSHSIMITDDHKTHPVPQTLNAIGSQVEFRSAKFEAEWFNSITWASSTSCAPTSRQTPDAAGFCAQRPCSFKTCISVLVQHGTCLEEAKGERAPSADGNGHDKTRHLAPARGTTICKPGASHCVSFYIALHT